MPGMMDTILNLGLNDQVVVGLAPADGQQRFAYDSYRRFIQMFSDVAMERQKSRLSVLSTKSRSRRASSSTELTADDMKELVVQFKGVYKQKSGTDFPFPSRASSSSKPSRPSSAAGRTRAPSPTAA